MNACYRIALLLTVTVAGLVLPAGCGTPGNRITIYVVPEFSGAVGSFVEFTPYEDMRVVESEDPAADATSGGGIRVALVSDLSCTECYRIDTAGEGYAVHAGDVLGLQYGLAHFLESLGFRFFHPFNTFVPGRFADPAKTVPFGETFTPDMSQRGFQLHTLHPIEALYAFWEPGGTHLEDARRIGDWIIKNRGNFVQWVALENIQDDPSLVASWREHTAAILADFHQRGLRVGIRIQLDGETNLQSAFDLLDETTVDPRTDMEMRLGVLLDGLPFDSVGVAFGEFFATDPDTFLDSVNMVYDVLQELSPGIDVTAQVHVGDDLRIDYMGMNLLYYFLVQYADPGIIPWIHTVMYYNLFDDAGLAYEHEDFAEHRAYLLDRIVAGEPVAYYPETAYWVAFDNSVPTYLPLYVHSRWIDLDGIAAEAAALGAPAGLDRHILFTSGWDWGYWQNDYASLRMSYSLPASSEDPLTDMFAPWGATGATLSRAVGDLARIQHRYLIVQRLAAYLAGRDSIIDLGDTIGIHSQPDRPSFNEVVAMTPGERATFVATVVAPLDAFATEMAEVHARVADLTPASVLGGDEWFDEVRDGIEVTLARARFIHAVYAAAVAFAETGSDDGWLATAETELEVGRGAVTRRHSALHYPYPDEILLPRPNDTIYPFGYLEKADTLCYWERELAQIRILVEGDGSPPSSCYF